MSDTTFSEAGLARVLEAVKKEPDDRELLELAAKANWAKELAGDEVALRYSDLDDGMLYLHADNQDHNGMDREFRWNPLTDDGDALRLAVILKMEIDHNHPADQDRWVMACTYGMSSHAVEEFGDESQRLTATRRAIVRAAAEIGRAKS